ncbi:MAG: ABC transporter ATP-binding protein [Faecalibacterium sp.]
MANTVLKVEDINVYYGAIHAIRDISFHVEEGEIVTLIGANGAGKSTNLKTISGLLRSKTGDVTFRGNSIKALPAHKIVEAGLAHVPEGRHVFLHMSVQENLEMGAYTQKKSTIEPNLERVFARFPRLKERRKQMAGTLSGGEQQMLAMGRAMMSGSNFLMLDEPSMGLAPLLVAEIFEIIKELNKEGMTILLVEQNAQMALSIADRAYVLETGRVVMEGTGAELLHDESVQSAYLGGE